jgi:gliding motility-associated-like protein
VITYTPNPGYTGSDSFTYTVKDASGLISNVATVNIVVVPTNDPPIAVDDGPITIESTMPVNIDVLANDNDPDNAVSELTIVSVSTPQLGTAVIDNGQVVYQAYSTNSGTDSFTYVISDPSGLTDTATVTIQYIYSTLLVSEGFSPNGDGVNDTWYIRSIEGFRNNSVKIFDRWGILVYQRNQYDNIQGWDGRANIGQESAKLLDEGTYYYILDLGNNKKPMSGYVTIVH